MMKIKQSATFGNVLWFIEVLWLLSVKKISDKKNNTQKIEK